MPFPANPLDEDAALRAEEDRQKRAKAAVAGGPDLAKKVGSIHRLYPHITPGVALSLAKANASEATIKSVAEQEVKRMAAKAAQDNEPKGVFGRLGSWAKTGTRWATAGLALPYEALTNVASQAFTGEGGMDGFFISTSLGTMLADDEKAGSGFFIGGDAAKKQADRARRYRGTIGGQAWTFGRGAASLVAEPGTDAYRLLSGLVDAAAVIGGDPLNYLVPGASGAVAARKGLTKLGPAGRIMPLADEVVEGIAGANKIADVNQAAGLVHETARQVNPMKARSWLDSAQGQRVVEKLAETRTLADTRKILPNVSIRTNLELTDAQTVDDVKSLLAGRLGLESGLVRASDIRYKSAFSGTPAVSERSRITRLFDKMPSRAISLRPSDRGIDEAVENIDRWLMSTGYKESERAPVVEEFARAMTGAMNPEERAARIASLQGAAESALDDQHRAAFQELLMLQDEATQISGRAVAEGFAVAEVQKLRQAYAASPVAVRGILTSREVRQGLQGIYGEAVRFMEAAGIVLDQKTLLPRAKMKIGVKNVKNGFDRFGHRVGGETDFTRRLGSMADHRRRGWVGFGESTLDRGHGAYRGGTKKGLIPVDEAFTNANAAMSRQFDNIDDFVDQFIRYADIIDTLRPYFKNPAKPRIPRKMYGRAGELLDPPSLFASRMYEGISFDDLVEAAYDKEAAAKVQSKFFDNEIGMIVDDAAAGNIDEFADLTPDDVYAIWGNALAGTESDALRQARGLSTQIEETQARLADIESKFKSVGLAVRGTDRQALYEVAEKFRGMVREGLVRNGVDGDLADELLDSYYSNISEQSLYAIDESGNVTDFGFGKALLSDENGVLQPVGGVLASPGLRSEMLSRHLYLPDPRRVRRLQSRVGWVTGVKKSNPELAGELRLPAAMVEFIQQDVWRPLTLMTGGYILRNIAEAQARMTLLSRTSIFKHPIQHIMWAAGWKGAGDVMGRVYELDAPSRFLVRGQQRAEVAGIDDLMRESHGDYIDSIRNSYHKYGGDPLAAQQRAVRSGAFAAVSKTSRREYIQGYVDELRQLSDDQIAKMIAQGNNMEQVLNWLRTTADGRTHWSQINEMFESGVRFTDQNGVVRTVQASLLDERNLRNYIDRYIVGRLNLKAGEIGRLPNDVLRDVAAHGLVRNGDEVALTADEVKKLRPVFKSQTEGNVGNIFLVRREVARKGAKRVEKSVYGKVVSEDEAGVMRLVLMDEAWDANRNATPTFRRVMTDLLENPETGQLLPRMVKSEIRVSPGRFGRGGLNEAGRRTFQGMDTMVDKFFGGLFGKTTAYLDRSPLFRQRYWEQVETMLPVVDGAAVAALRDNVIEAATRLGVKPENYVGSKSLWKRMEAVPADRKGRVNLEQMDEYAKGHGLDAVKNELYNATDRNNLTDVARVIAPFGQAWGEILKTWVNLAASDPRILRRANVIVEGAKDADPDGDGRGFFYKDPVSGEYVFNYPMSDKFVALLTGPVSQALNRVPVLNRFGSDAGSVDAMLTAPVRSLNVGFTLTPGLGPMAQIPAALILRNIPKADEVKKILMPFGDPSLRGQAFMPAWFQKFTSGLWDTPNTTRLMGQTYVEVIQHLYTSGDYNVQDVNDRERMFEDAIGLARSLSVLRAFGQFMGPTRPTVEFQEADLPAAFYAAELRKLQDPEQGGDYDTAVANFLTLYPEAVAYVGSKTKSEYGGLDITEAFGKWEEDNGQILDRYKDIGGFFAPFDDTVDMAVWSRQLAAGKRTRNTAREVIEIAEYRAANSIYKKAAEAFPGTRTEDQRALLRNLRNVLSKKYPGFATLQMFDTQKFNRQVEQLRRATQDEDLQGNPVRDATAAYLDVRDQVLGVVESRGRSTTNGITSDKDDDLRAILRQYAESLVKKYPDFARLYDRILSREVESDTEPSGQ